MNNSPNPAVATEAARPVSPSVMLPAGIKSLEQIAGERGGRLTEREAVAYVRRAALSLGQLHRGGRCHGSIGVATVGIDSGGQIVLAPVAAPPYDSSCEADTRSLAHLLYLLMEGRAPRAQETQWPGSLAVSNALQKALSSRAQAPNLEAWAAQLVPGIAPASPDDRFAHSPHAISNVPVTPHIATQSTADAVQSTADAHAASQSTAEPQPIVAAPEKPRVVTAPALLPTGDAILVRRIAATNSRFVRVAWAADGEVWSATENGVAQIWSVRTGVCGANLSMYARSGGVTAVAFGMRGNGASAGDSLVVSGHEDGTLRLWDARGNRLRRTFSAHKGRVSALALSLGGSNARLASGGGDGSLLWWNIDEGKRAGEMAESATNIKVLAASPAGARVAAGGDGGRLEVWNARNAQKEWSNTEHEFWLTALAFSPDEKMLASGAYDRTIRLWSADAGAPLQTLNGHEALVNSLHFSPRGRLLASGGADGSVRLWDAWTGEAGPVLRDWNGGANGVAFSPGGRFLAVAADDSLSVWKFDS